MEDLQQRLENGEKILLDGATGTELEKRGVPMDSAAWCAMALATHPDTVREVHEDYIRAGAEVIITNTFPAAKHVLQEAGAGDRFKELNTRAAELANEAARTPLKETSTSRVPSPPSRRGWTAATIPANSRRGTTTPSRPRRWRERA